MKHLYIIGNGFDLFTGLHTSYSDFKHWLEHKYIFVYENMKAAYNMDGKWWNDFEVNLGELDIHQYVRNFTPPEKSSKFHKFSARPTYRVYLRKSASRFP